MSESVQVVVANTLFNVVVEHDESPISPREWDNVGEMLCSHRRYNLGDYKLNQCYNSESFMDDLSQHAYDNIMGVYFDSKYICDYSGDLNRAGLDRALKWVTQNMIVLPLYLYDHSGITMSTSPFGCSWDSGSVGFVFCTKAKARHELGVKRLTKAHIERIQHLMKSEVTTYDAYLTGNVFNYHVEGIDDGGCGGFYGDDYSENGLLSSATDLIDYELNKRKNVHLNKLKNQIIHRVPLSIRAPFMSSFA